MGEVRELVRHFVVENFILDPDNDFTDETDLKETGILDSLAALKLINFLEDQFEFHLPAEDLEANGLFSVANIEKLVLSRKQ